MEYRRLGLSGIRVSPLALGTDNFANPSSEQESVAILERAIDAGINLIDTSNSYAQGEAEQIIGRAFKRNSLRDNVIIATKAHYPTGLGANDYGNTRLHLLKACEDSLKRLQVDHIDLFQLHRPDFTVAIEETLSALSDMVRAGMVRYIGMSTTPAWKVMEAIMMSELKGFVRFTSEQPPYNLLDRRIENELVPTCQAYDVGLITWSPLAMGILAGRYKDANAYPKASRAELRGGIYAERVTQRGIEVGNKFVTLANEKGISPAQLAVLWVKDQAGITAPLIGPRTVEQLEHFLPVSDMTLDEETRAACDALVPAGSFVANFHNSAPWMKMQTL